MAKFDRQLHHRHSIRLEGYDYTQPGAYFVTVVTWQRECLFGAVRSGEMHLNPYGSLIQNEWRRLGKRFDRILLDEFIVMPNHLHGILVILEDVGARQEGEGKIGEVGARQKNESKIGEVGARQKNEGKIGEVGARQKGESTIGESPFASPLQGVIPRSLGAIVGAYKSTTARLIDGLRRSPGAPVWQRNYYEHIIRDEAEWTGIRTYIQDNPLGWESDNENPSRYG